MWTKYSVESHNIKCALCDYLTELDCYYEVEFYDNAWHFTVHFESITEVQAVNAWLDNTTK